MPRFVDVHSHMVPSGDDGVQTIEEGLDLLREARRRGTRVLYGTPHANELHPMSPERRERTEAAYAEMALEAESFDLDLQLGFELAAEPWLLDADPRDYRLGDLDAALLEFPLPHTGTCDLELLTLGGEHLEAEGLVPVLAHPERCALVQADPDLVLPFRERGWLLQVNATSLLKPPSHPDHPTGWLLLENGLADLVATDAHRPTRPPYLDGAHAAVAARIGRDAADRLLGGEALERAAARS